MQLTCRICRGDRLAPLGEVDGYPFVECERCAFTFSPVVTLEGMQTLYQEGYHGPRDGGPEAGWSDDGFLAPALERLPAGPLRILDFGTGQSVVPDRLRARGHRVVALDVAPPIRPHPDRLTGDLPTLGLPAASFDLVYSFQVFEHLAEPVPILEALLRLVRPGGYLLIHTDMEMPERQGGFTRWWYVLPPDHCAFYRHRTFEWYLARTPHRLVHQDPKVVLVQAA